MRPRLRTILLGLSVAAAVSACAAPVRAPAPIEHGGSGAARAQGGCGRSLTVQSGDTLYAIAQRCGVSLADLAAENGLREPYTLQRGQTVRLPGPSVYTVRRGDNLYRIALAHGMSTEELARLNSLRQPYTIYPGQELAVRGQARSVVAQAQPASSGASAQPSAPTRRASPPPRASTANAPSFQWPLQGQVITPYGGAEGARIDGIRIAARLGDPVRAAADGEVVYAGNELQGYGELVLIRHENNWVTAYGLNSILRVNVGDRVTAGQHIADAGASGSETRTALHFEVRRGVSPVDPMQVLPSR
ncbi:MAG: peptidoglycan-binding protein [Oceanicaulis sp.]|uniref:LysM peptidoglycan-binding domain-containing protein n=1 Tax=unclassified Oceanicaulis TaxID=2632123 RepID=UPI000C684412|nr:MULTISPECIES: LysM peptidoglycan-binding domain-containing protein [unclassified Oceanicaulis]MAB69471.1 peptidoglycan-binding protein [Oceanicaulis sp.]MBC38999.1 peptidoglycan-binding protein [Oceanicaulis sp.]MBG34747.1 peptidoglycan-binding protein [Oceanicaulis sp.]HBU61970.1 peptidoglycan-binding protein [Oceanicaulis sp.]HCR93492.1 peptidoglycan-binding protein [Oceanicaulis sp.]|tara:strand:- start:56 stop:967 length:912 start_codon:yes stop_codon:yes gene_type:complete